MHLFNLILSIKLHLVFVAAAVKIYSNQSNVLMLQRLQYIEVNKYTLSWHASSLRHICSEIPPSRCCQGAWNRHHVPLEALEGDIAYLAGISPWLYSFSGNFSIGYCNANSRNNSKHHVKIWQRNTTALNVVPKEELSYSYSCMGLHVKRLHLQLHVSNFFNYSYGYPQNITEWGLIYLESY